MEKNTGYVTEYCQLMEDCFKPKKWRHLGFDLHEKNNKIDVILVETVTGVAKQQRNDLNIHLTDHRSRHTDPGWSADTVDHPSQNQTLYVFRSTSVFSVVHIMELNLHLQSNTNVP